MECKIVFLFYVCLKFDWIDKSQSGFTRDFFFKSDKRIISWIMTVIDPPTCRWCVLNIFARIAFTIKIGWAAQTIEKKKTKYLSRTRTLSKQTNWIDHDVPCIAETYHQMNTIIDERKLFHNIVQLRNAIF